MWSISSEELHVCTSPHVDKNTVQCCKPCAALRILLTRLGYLGPTRRGCEMLNEQSKVSCLGLILRRPEEEKPHN